MPFDDVVSELNLALAECRKALLEHDRGPQALDLLRHVIRKIELALDLLKSSHQG